MATVSKSRDAAGGGVPSGHVWKQRKVKSGPLEKVLERIYKAGPASAGTPSVAQFASWLESTESTVAESEIPSTDGAVTFEDFKKFIGSQHGSAITPVDWSKKDLTRPLNEYFISR